MVSSKSAVVKLICRLAGILRVKETRFLDLLAADDGLKFSSIDHIEKFVQNDSHNYFRNQDLDQPTPNFK